MGKRYFIGADRADCSGCVCSLSRGCSVRSKHFDNTIYTELKTAVSELEDAYPGCTKKKTIKFITGIDADKINLALREFSKQIALASGKFRSIHVPTGEG